MTDTLQRIIGWGLVLLGALTVAFLLGLWMDKQDRWARERAKRLKDEQDRKRKP